MTAPTELCALTIWLEDRCACLLAKGFDHDHRPPMTEHDGSKPIRRDLFQHQLHSGAWNWKEFRLQADDVKFDLGKGARKQVLQFSASEHSRVEAIRRVFVDFMKGFPEELPQDNAPNESTMEIVNEAVSVVNHKAESSTGAQHARDFRQAGLHAVAVV